MRTRPREHGGGWTVIGGLVVLVLSTGLGAEQLPFPSVEIVPPAIRFAALDRALGDGRAP